MTFCLGIKVHDGLIGMADTRITSGTERITSRKISLHQHGQHTIFIMTSGLRSVRDKAVVYFEESIEENKTSNKMYKAVNAFAGQVRRVAAEDKEVLHDSGFYFNLHALVGGQLEDDREHKLFMIYPQGNWVEVDYSTPYYIIGESCYGKPILDRALHYNSDLRYALVVGLLAFNATLTSATDVALPIDVVAYRRDTYELVEARYDEETLREVFQKWNELVVHAVDQMPTDWTNRIMSQLEAVTTKPHPGGSISIMK